MNFLLSLPGVARLARNLGFNEGLRHVQGNLLADVATARQVGLRNDAVLLHAANEPG